MNLEDSVTNILMQPRSSKTLSSAPRHQRTTSVPVATWFLNPPRGEEPVPSDQWEASVYDGFGETSIRWLLREFMLRVVKSRGCVRVHTAPTHSPTDLHHCNCAVIGVWRSMIRLKSHLVGSLVQEKSRWFNCLLNNTWYTLQLYSCIQLSLPRGGIWEFLSKNFTGGLQTVQRVFWAKTEFGLFVVREKNTLSCILRLIFVFAPHIS